MPTSADHALLQAQASLISAIRGPPSAATGDGGAGCGKRLRVELMPPGLNRLIENSHAYSEPLLGFTSLALAEAMEGLTTTVIFPSAGTAAAAQAVAVVVCAVVVVVILFPRRRRSRRRSAGR